MATLTIDLKDRAYDILIEGGCLDRAGGEIAKRLPKARRAAIISDTNVAPLYAGRAEESLRRAGLEVHTCVLPAGEASKRMEYLTRVYDFLCAHRLSRSDVLIALGGGVMGDLGGLAAATYLRGIPFVQMPTSLLAQVDSAVGGKVAIDLPQGKNLVGAFYQPRLVLADTDTLATLSDHYWRDGMGEVIKYGCIRDARFLDWLTTLSGREGAMAEIGTIVRTCLILKAQVVVADEFDTGERMILNFGHTLGHAIETAQHYEGLSHGAAVAVGMALITRLSESKGLTQPGTCRRLLAALAAQGLANTVKLERPEELLDALILDKKHLEGQLNVVLLEKIGRCYLHTAGADFFREVLQWL